MKKTGWIVSPAPFLLTRPTVTRMTVVTACTLMPQLALIAMDGDVQSLVTIASAILGSVLAEFLFSFPDRKNSLRDGSVILSGLLVGMLLPSTLNPVISLAVAFIGMLVARNLFGGSGSYWIHPVAVSVAIAYIGSAAFFPAQLVTGDGIRTVGDAFGAFKLDGFAQNPQDQAVTGTINAFLLRIFGIKLPEGYVTLFWSAPSVIPAFRYNAFILAGSVVLIAMNIIDWIVPLAYLVSYALCVYFLSLMPFGSLQVSGDMLFAFLTSGTLFAAFYLLPDYSTNPRTRIGKAISGTLAGIVAFVVSGPGGAPAGSVFTVLVINAFNPVIEYLENRYIAAAGDFA